jgi:hypothetical protein
MYSILKALQIKLREYLLFNEQQKPNNSSINQAKKNCSAANIFGTLCKFMMLDRNAINGGFNR